MKIKFASKHNQPARFLKIQTPAHTFFSVKCYAEGFDPITRLLEATRDSQPSRFERHEMITTLA
jgi:hypothetical protein